MNVICVREVRNLNSGPNIGSIDILTLPAFPAKEI